MILSQQITSTATMTQLHLGERSLQIDWSDGRKSTFHYLWLRDNCPQSRLIATDQRIVETIDIPENLCPLAGYLTDDNQLQITWANDGHVSRYDGNWLRVYDYSNGAKSPHRLLNEQPKLWDATIKNELSIFDYSSLIMQPSVERAFLNQFHALGFGILGNVPTELGQVLKVGSRFGIVRPTSWGELFDIKARVDTDAVAYTNIPLAGHTDSTYRNPPPSIQILHCLVSETEGGESTLIDGFKIAADLRTQAPQKFNLLATTPLHFYSHTVNTEHHAISPVIRLDARGNVEGIRYSNHSVQPFLLPSDTMEAYYDAYCTFGRMREHDIYQIRYQLRPGDLYMVDNRRVMHGRTGFSRGGDRHLQGCYIEYDELLSRREVLNRDQFC